MLRRQLDLVLEFGPQKSLLLLNDLRVQMAQTKDLSDLTLPDGRIEGLQVAVCSKIGLVRTYEVRELRIMLCRDATGFDLNGCKGLSLSILL